MSDLKSGTDPTAQRHKTLDKQHRKHQRDGNAVSKSKNRKASKRWKTKPPAFPDDNNASENKKVYKIHKPWTKNWSPFPDAQRRRLRDIKRKFQHHSAANIPATLKSRLEREAQSIAHELAVHEAEERRRYVMMQTKAQRFFEQQKALRRLKKAEKENQSDAANADLIDSVKEAKLDLAYANFYPLEADYVPLWPSHQKEPTEAKGDPAMRERIKLAMEEEKLEELKHELTIYEEAVSTADDEAKEADEDEESFFTK